MTIALNSLIPTSFEPDYADSPRGPTSRERVWGNPVRWEPGKRYLIASRSGSGKTSLSAFISGRRFDYHGSIVVADRDTRTYGQADWAGFRTNVLAQVFQDLRLIPSLSARDNLEILRHALGKDAAPATKLEIETWAEELEIANLLHAKAGELSRGEQQRVAILRCLVARTPFILLDEAFSHLDEQRSVGAAKLVDRIASERGTAVIHLNIESDRFFPYDEERVL